MGSSENLQNTRYFDRDQSWIDQSEQVSNIQISLPDQITGFYGTDEFTFSSCGMSGMFGPNLKKCISFYNVDWVKNSNYFSIWKTGLITIGKLLKSSKNGIQKVTIPTTAEYELTAFGAGWTNYGAMAKSHVKLQHGTQIFIGIGQRGKNTEDGCGGTFVAIRENGNFIPIIIAGGAGGGYENEYGNGSNDQFGNRSEEIEERNKNIGKGGKSGNSFYYNGGNGFEGRIKGNWEKTKETPKSFEDGLNGGKRKDYDNEGGFGGGGVGTGGGGGGYTGGQGGYYINGIGYGGGGGSFTQNGKGIQKGHKGPGKLIIKIVNNN